MLKETPVPSVTKVPEHGITAEKNMQSATLYITQLSDISYVPQSIDNYRITSVLTPFTSKFLRAVKDDINVMACDKIMLNVSSYCLYFEHKALFAHKHKRSTWKGSSTHNKSNWGVIYEAFFHYKFFSWLAFSAQPTLQ